MLAAFTTHELYVQKVVHFGSDQSANFGQAIVAFLVDAAVSIAVTMVTRPKEDDELRGLVWGLTRKEEEAEEEDPADKAWYRSPALLGAGALILVVILNIIFI